MSDCRKTFFPKLVVPAIPHDGKVRFLMEKEQIDVEAEYSNAIWKILSLANGYNDVDTIAEESGLALNVVNGIIQDLLRLGVLYDSREQYLYFHKLSSSPDIYSQNLTIEDSIKLQSMTRKSKIGRLLPYAKDRESNLSKLIFNRRSCRNFNSDNLNCDIVSNICFHGYSIANHSVPSGGALYPLKLYIIVERDQKDLQAGYYEFDSTKNALRCYKSKIDIEQLKYCFNDIVIPFNSCIQIVIAGNLSRETSKYSNRGYRLTLIEVGQVAQNISLYCEECGLGSCELGGVLDKALANELEMEDDVPLLTIAIGRRASDDSEEAFDHIVFEDMLSKMYVGEEKIIKSCVGIYLGDEASFFGACADLELGDGGAGATSTSCFMAKAKAIVEGHERYVSEHPVVDFWATAENLEEDWIDPNLIHPTSEFVRDTLMLHEFTPKSKIAWKWGKYIINGKRVAVPIDLVYYGYYSTEQKICYTTSSGVAAHTDYNLAIQNALFELIERDAIMRNWYERKPPYRVNIAHLPFHIQKRCDFWKCKGRSVYILDMGSKYLPVIEVIIVSPKYPCFVCGAAASFNAEDAALKAMQEAEFSLYSLLKETPQNIKPEEVHTPIDHGRLYSTSDYIYNIEWLWTRNEMETTLPVANYSYDELLKLLNPIVIDMSIDDIVKVTRIISKVCLPINFGYQNNGANHPVMNDLNVDSRSMVLPHYFA